ncbi:MAG: MFS transporter [Candidatus Thorarchaeota archaeon]
MAIIKGKEVKNDKHFFYTIVLLPSLFTWVLLIAFVLIFSFDMMDYINANNIFPGAHNFFIMIIWAVPAGITGSFSGMVIDKYPKYLGKFTTLGLIGSSVFLAIDMIALQMVNALILMLAVFCLGASMGILTITAHTLYGTMIPWKYRGRGYSWAIFGGLSFCFLILLGAEMFDYDFFFSFSLISVLGILLAIILYYSTRDWHFWENDPWSTPLFRILKRPSVGAYYWTHTLIYLMLGLTIGSLAQAGIILGFNPILGSWYKSFWFIVLFGSCLCILPSGFLTDRCGRKTSIILAIYGIVFASLLVGLFSDYSPAYLISAFLIGISFALIHPALDGSLWVDLSPRDSIGRYSTLNFQSLGLGIYIGFPVSYLFITEQILDITLIMNVFILLGLALLASAPLFWIGDSFPPLEFFLLLIINDAGIPIFHYDFGRKKELKVDLPLISGALSAVGSFMLEATGEEGASLSLVRHGTHFIISDDGKMGLSAAIFSNKNDPELHGLLHKFLTSFEQKFRDVIPTWSGDLTIFRSAIDDAEVIFGPLVTIEVT